LLLQYQVRPSMRLAVLSVVVVLCLQVFLGASIQEIWEQTDGNQKGVGEGYNYRTQRSTGYPLFQWTPSTADTVTIGGVPYYVPDELIATPDGRNYIDSSVMIMDSFEQYQKMKASSWSVSLGVTLYGVEVALGYSRLKGQISTLTKNHSRSFNYASSLWRTFDLEIDSYNKAKLDSDFVGNYMILPKTYTPANRGLFLRFVNGYGTHFFSKAAYGCKWNYTMAFDRAMTEKSGSKWSQSQVSVSVGYSMGAFGFNIGMSFAKFKNESHIDGEFQRRSNGLENLLGGDETLHAKGLDVWIKSCKTNRALLVEKSKIVPIAEIIREPARKAAMILFLKDYARNPTW